VDAKAGYSASESMDRTWYASPGFDALTGLYYYAGSLNLPDIPEVPTSSDLDKARKLLVDDLLGEFNFGDKHASRATVLAALLLQRRFLMCLAPRGIVAAAVARIVQS
jgi:hypothetical protein